MREIDLDLLAAQAEHDREEIAVTFKGTKFTFPPEKPVAISLVTTELLNKGRLAIVHRNMELAFGPEQWEQFLELRPADDDLFRLWNALLGAYAVTEGESSSSAESSAPAGESSKPSSKGSTDSTRGKSSPKQASDAS